jgi:hypothetical protein
MGSLDITKCSGENCDKKEKCYRFLAKDSEYRQSYLVIENVKECREFWEMKNDHADLQKSKKR